MKFELVTKGYQGRSSQFNTQRRVNLFLESAGQGSKTAVSMVGTPGLYNFCYTGANSIRGMHAFNGVLYFVAGNALYSLSTTGIKSAQLGSNLTTSSGRVVMVDNGLVTTLGGGNQLAIADGSFIYIWNVNSSSWTQVGAPTTGSYTIDLINTYFVADVGGGVGNAFQMSSSYDGTTWNSPQTAFQYPDKLQCVKNNHGELWLIKERCTEIWQSTGQATPLYAPAVGGTLDFGTASRYSVARGNNGLFWLGTRNVNDSAEFIGVVMAQGYTITPVSTPSINYQMSQYSTISDAFGWCMNVDGHEWYVITFPTMNVTWVYDITMDAWHEWSSWTGELYTTGRHIANCYAYFNGGHYVGDANNGNIYQVSTSFLTDNNNPIGSFLTSPYIYDSEELYNVFISRLQVDAETGVRTPGKSVVISYNGTMHNLYSASDGTAWLSETSQATFSASVASNGISFAAIGGNSTSIFQYTLDAKAWVAAVLSQSASWQSIAGNRSIYIAVAVDSNKAVTSTDSTNWLNITGPFAGGCDSIAASLSTFCAMNAAGTQSATTTDGASWTTGTATSGLFRVSYGNIFTAVSNSQDVGTSADGLAWTKYVGVLPYSGQWAPLCWNESVYCTVLPGTNHCAVSSDFQHWTSGTLPFTLGAKPVLGFNGKYYIVFNYGTNQAAYSTNGLNWTAITLPVSDNWFSFASTYQPIQTANIYMSTSSDGGNTFSTPIAQPLGTAGMFSSECTWWGLGLFSSVGSVVRIGIQDNIRKVLFGASIDVTKGYH